MFNMIYPSAEIIHSNRLGISTLKQRQIKQNQDEIKKTKRLDLVI